MIKNQMIFVELEDLNLALMASWINYRHVPDLFWDNFPNITSLKITSVDFIDEVCPLLTVMETIPKQGHQKV